MTTEINLHFFTTFNPGAEWSTMEPLGVAAAKYIKSYTHNGSRTDDGSKEKYMPN